MKEYKKFPNRRLYDLQKSCYVTLLDVQQAVESGEQIEVRTGKKGAERLITREILLDVLKAKELELPKLDIDALRRLIRTGRSVGSA